MTALDYSPDLPPLLTDDDVLHRLKGVLGPAAENYTLWLMFLDGDRKQTPVVMPINDVGPQPEPQLIENIGSVFTGILAQLQTTLGPGSLIATLERLGAESVRPGDQAWADALAECCARSDIDLRGFYLSAPNIVARLR